MLLGCFWICGRLDQSVNKFALEAVLHSFGTSEFGIVISYFLSDSERGKETENRRYFLREQLSWWSQGISSENLAVQTLGWMNIFCHLSLLNKYGELYWETAKAG